MEGWCSQGHSPKLVAAIVAHRGSLWLWLPGGRAGSHAEMVAEWKRSIEDIRHDLADMTRRGIPTEQQQAHRESLNEFEQILAEWQRQRWPAVSPATARPLSSLPGAGWSGVTACRGCRRDVAVTLSAQLNLSVARVARPDVS